MRILHLLDHSLPLHSGYSFRTHAILKEQKKRGWQTRQITSSKQDHDKNTVVTVDAITYERSTATENWRQRLPVFNQLAVSRDLAACAVPLVQDFAPQILHAHSSSLNGLAGITLARRFKLPLVYELRAFWEDAAVDHGTTTEGSARYRATRMLETHVLRKADAVTTICHGIRQDLIGRGIPPEKITVIPNAVDVDAFDHTSKPDTATADRLGITGKTVLGFIGSFYAYEGLDLLIAALPKILANVNDACLLLVGGGYQDAALRAQVQQLGLTDKVIFTGRVPHEQVSTYYDLIDVLVYPRHSMRLTETVTPLKPLEAMAQGRLLIASDVGGHKELIEDGVTGSLFRAGDADDLAATACALLSDRSNWPARISAGRHFVEKERSWPTSVSNYEPVYRSLLTNPA